MNRIVVATALATALFVTGLASAENALFPSNNASAQVTFYRTSPTDSFPLATAMVNNSPIAPIINDIEAASHITVVHEGESYTFALAESGRSKNDVWLEIADGPTAASHVSDTGTMSLSALMEGLSVNPELLEELHSSAPGV